MWDHVRGNDVDDDGRLLMGRQGWFDEVMRFYDHYLQGGAPTPQRPAGRGRDERRQVARRGAVAAGRRVGRDRAEARHVHRRRQEQRHRHGGAPNGQGMWTISPPLAHDAHLAGVPRSTRRRVERAARREPRRRRLRRRPEGQATLVSRATTCCPAAASRFDLYGNDWSCPRATGSACWSRRRTASGGCTGRRRRPWRSSRTRRSRCRCLVRAAPTIQGDPSIKLESYRRERRSPSTPRRSRRGPTRRSRFPVRAAL